MNPRANSSSLLLDGYTADELGPKNTVVTIDARRPRGTPLLAKSKFTTVTPLPGGRGVEETAQTSTTMVTNKANPRHNPSLRVSVQRNIPASDPDSNRVWLYLSPSTFTYAAGLAPGETWSKPIRVSVLYGVGSEMNRHGLRTSVASRPEPSALILVPGVEPRNPGDPRFGIGIDDLDLRRLLESALGRSVVYRTVVAAAFSTGINGLNQTLLNNLIDVSHVERVVIYDCLYSQSSGSTGAALAQAKRRAGPNLKIIVYKCTAGGNSLNGTNQLAVAVNNPGLIPPGGIIEELFFVPGYSALITFRSLEGGIADGLVTLPSTGLSAAFTAMKAIVPARNTVLSSRRAWAHVFGKAAPPSGSVFFETWAGDKAHRAVIRDFVRFLGSVTKADTIRNLIWTNQLPGWPGGDGEENHDLLLPDFGWEYLPA